jgi:hypothetical protein
VNRRTDDRTAGAVVGVRGKKKIIFNLDSAAVTDAFDQCRDRP